LALLRAADRRDDRSMQTSTTSGPAGTQSPHHPRDVVAGLVNDGMAILVAGAAVREAVVRVGQYCQEHALCDVLTVSGPDSQLEPAGGGSTVTTP